MKKNILILLLITIVLILNLVGCSGNNASDNAGTGNLQNNSGNNSQASDNQTNTTGKEVIGKLVGISSNEIKISEYGNINTYNIAGDKVKDYYLGETLLLKGNGTDYDVSSYDKYSLDARKTDEGDEITRVVGKVTDVGDEYITAVTDNGDISIMNPGNFNLPVESNVIFDYVNTKEGNRLISYYDDSIRMDLTIDEIQRDIDGKMLLIATDINNKEYDITVNRDVVMNVNHSTLRAGDNIKVYPTTIGDENPPKVNVSMIIK